MKTICYCFRAHVEWADAAGVPSPRDLGGRGCCAEGEDRHTLGQSAGRRPSGCQPQHDPLDI